MTRREKLIDRLIEYDSGLKQEFFLRKIWIDSYAEYKHKRITSILHRLRVCPECRGRGTVPDLEWQGPPYREYQVIVYEPCQSCNGTGRIG